VNFNTPALLFGLILLVASIALFVFGRLKPELQRDSDSVYAIVGIVCALILFGSAFDLSLGMSFQQLLMIGSLIALMWQNIQARQPKNMEARSGVLDGLRGRGNGREKSRRGPLDDDRPVSRIRAEFDPTPLDDPYSSRRIRGGQDSWEDDWEGSRRKTRRNEYADDVPRRPRGSLNGSPMVDDEDDRPRLRAARPLPPDRSDSNSWGDDKPVRRPRSSDTESVSRERSDRSERSRSDRSDRSDSVRPDRSSRRNRPDSSRRRNPEPSADYVDYQPVDFSESGNRDYD
jgi:hypothetical protein